MANALAQSIGAQAACRDRQVVALCGDGGFTMLMGDLLSLGQLDLPIKVIVFNNGALGFIELEQKSVGFLDTGTRLDNPDFAAMAEAVGIKGLRITDPADAERVLREAFAHPGPVLIDAVVDRMELAIPPKITLEMARGFTLYMLKAVLGGRADEVIDLAVTNFRR
jgi:pyruvate dehydrogenase (quinone)